MELQASGSQSSMRETGAETALHHIRFSGAFAVLKILDWTTCAGTALRTISTEDIAR